ncbi:MAG: hypothetical protein KH135_03150 [Firmicutes bacterium]|nr:hypothetical protein [Bacillota bacterium]
MKNKWGRNLSIIQYVTSNEKFKMIFFASILLCLYGTFGLTLKANNYIDAIYIVFTFPLFNLLLFSLLLFYTFQVCTLFYDEFDAYQIRLKNKKAYLKELLKIVILSNLFYLLVFLLLFFIFLNMTNYGYFRIHDWNQYGINNLIYVLFYMIRYFIYGILFCLMIALLYRPYHQKSVMLSFVLFLSGFLFCSNTKAEVSTMLLPWNYYHMVCYDSFQVELLSSFGYFFLLLFVTWLFYQYRYRKRGM